MRLKRRIEDVQQVIFITYEDDRGSLQEIGQTRGRIKRTSRFPENYVQDGGDLWNMTLACEDNQPTVAYSADLPSVLVCPVLCPVSQIPGRAPTCMAGLLVGSLFLHISFKLCSNRGLTEENIQLGLLSPIMYFKSPIGDILTKWGLGICSLTLFYLTQKSPILNWVYYCQLGI